MDEVDGQQVGARRIHVKGVSGSGKTTFARDLAVALGLAHLELDAVFWDAGWTFRDLDEARGIILDLQAAHPEGWVVDGNWTSRRDGLLDPGTPGGADLLIWLDYRRAVVMQRLIRRTVRRGVTREELWHGNRERPGTWFNPDPHENILVWGWKQHGVQREREGARVAAGDPILRVATPRAARRLLNRCRESGVIDGHPGVA